MPRLFIAIDLPDEIKSTLQQCQPPSLPGIRNTRREQLHLTLHFLGESSIEPVATALQAVRITPLTLLIEGVGSFTNNERGSILWAGIRPSTELTDLHQSIAAALVPIGFRPETRLYAPHITLARCESRIPAEIVQSFLKAHANLSLPPVTITELRLYSSTLSSAGPSYKLEAQASGP